MRVDVSLEFRFQRTPDGAAWTESAFPRPFWDRYLEVFDSVRIIAHAHPVAETSEGFRRVDGDAVELWPVPPYVGPAQFARKYLSVRERARAAIGSDDAVIMRVASPIATVIAPVLRRRRRPFGLEVVGDPHDAFRRGSIDHPARAATRRWLTRSLRRMCRDATAVAYVTGGALQARYPAGPGALSTHYSSIDLPDGGIVAAARHPVEPAQRLVTVAALDQRYKGVDVLLDAVGRCSEGGRDFHLTVVGDGKLRGELEARAAGLGIEKQVDFTGQLPGEQVVGRLDAADLFVLASRTEGLPRALVEAMARGLPCVASAVGGVPELLAGDDLTAPGDVGALADKLLEVAGAPERLAGMSARNLARAGDYRESALRPRRNEFYRRVRAASESWLAGRP